MEVKCPRCKRPVSLAYEGSHDWNLECEGCKLALTLYVPHVGDEAEQARITVDRITIHPWED